MLADTIAKFVAIDIRPFSTVEGVGFKELAQAFVNIGVTYGKIDITKALPKRKAITHQVQQLAIKAKADLATLLPKYSLENKIAFTTDLWKDGFSFNNYICLIAYTIHDFEIKTHSQACSLFDLEHKNAYEIKKFLLEILASLDINENGFTKCFWTTDCGSNLLAGLSEFNHLNCIAHRLNTVLKVAWTKLETNFSDVKNFRHHAKELVTFAKKGDLNTRLSYTLKKECDSRWNSFYTLLASIDKSYKK